MGSRFLATNYLPIIALLPGTTGRVNTITGWEPGSNRKIVITINEILERCTILLGVLQQFFEQIRVLMSAPAHK
jgi:hypothetical protein